METTIIALEGDVNHVMLWFQREHQRRPKGDSIGPYYKWAKERYNGLDIKVQETLSPND